MSDGNYLLYLRNQIDKFEHSIDVLEERRGDLECRLIGVPSTDVDRARRIKKAMAECDQAIRDYRLFIEDARKECKP